MSDLLKACVTGNIEEVQSFINLGDIEAKDINGCTPLHNASGCGQIDIVKLLIDLDADIESEDSNGRTSLHFASSYGHIDIVKLLINLGANIEVKSNYGWTPLHSSSCRGHIDIVKLFIYLGADVKAINNIGKTPAQVAQTTAIKTIIECYERMIQLKEWRPWNHSKYSSGYRNTIKTLVLLAKQLKND